MKFIYNPSEDYKDVPHSYYDLHRFDDGSNEEIFFYGYNCSVNDDLKNQYKSYKRKIYYNWEAPCAFQGRTDAVSSQIYFDEVYTLCPYTADYINGKHGDITKQIAVPYTIRGDRFKRYVSNHDNKEFDVMYQGHFLGKDHDEMVNMMIKHKYAICSIGWAPYITHPALNSDGKMDLISRSKISVAMNLLYVGKEQVEYIKKTYPDYKDNLAFSHLDEGVAPQFKSRIMEAAFCKSLNLVKYDQWNVVEKWFEPGKDFIYYYNPSDLDEKIAEISKNYEKYIPIIESAHEKVLKYDIDEQIKKIINKQTDF
jgi:hypothetical protein